MGGRGASSGRAGGTVGTRQGEGFTIMMGGKDKTYFIDASGKAREMSSATPLNGDVKTILKNAKERGFLRKTYTKSEMSAMQKEPGENQMSYVNIFLTGAIKTYGKLVCTSEELFNTLKGEEYHG